MRIEQRTIAYFWVSCAGHIQFFFFNTEWHFAFVDICRLLFTSVSKKLSTPCYLRLHSHKRNPIFLMYIVHFNTICYQLFLQEREEKQKQLEQAQKEAMENEQDDDPSNLFLRNIESVQRRPKQDSPKSESIDKRQVRNYSVLNRSVLDYYLTYCV